MASGFIILNDGRCWARRWTGYDLLLDITAQEIGTGEHETALKSWLLSLLPTEKDIEIGYGFVKEDTGETIIRNLDLRELTETNQRIFWEALQKATTKMILTPGEANESFIWLLKRILRMRRLVRIRDNPDNCSDWNKGYTTPPSGKKTGPGW